MYTHPNRPFWFKIMVLFTCFRHESKVLSSYSPQLQNSCETAEVGIVPWRIHGTNRIFTYMKIKKITLQGTNISPKNGILKMIFLFPRWGMLIPWGVTVYASKYASPMDPSWEWIWHYLGEVWGIHPDCWWLRGFLKHLYRGLQKDVSQLSTYKSWDDPPS